jgi:acetyl esterase
VIIAAQHGLIDESTNELTWRVRNENPRAPDMALDPQVQYVLDRVRKAGVPEYWQMTPEQARDWHNRKAGILDIKPAPVFKVENRAIPSRRGAIPLRSYTPREAAEGLPVLVWLHGGGHVIGSLDSYDAVCRQLALQADCVVVSVDYRLAPENKFPAGVEDAFEALTWVGRHAGELGADPTRVAVGGDSAGANLAAVCAILARDAGFPHLLFELLIYPRLAPDEDSPSHRELAHGYLLTRRTILWFHDHYRASDEDRRDFRYAPLVCHDLSRLPPALIIVAEFDPLKDEGLEYARRLGEAGNQVEAVTYPGVVHGFFSMGGAVDAGRHAQAFAAAALRRGFATGAAGH